MRIPRRIKRITISLDDYVIEIAEQKSKAMFKGDMDNYINWLICNNNKHAVEKKIRALEKRQEEKKPSAILDSVKTAMYNNVCEYCNEDIYQGDEICRAEGYDNYIHKKCCKSEE